MSSITKLWHQKNVNKQCNSRTEGKLSNNKTFMIRVGSSQCNIAYNKNSRSRINCTKVSQKTTLNLKSQFGYHDITVKSQSSQMKNVTSNRSNFGQIVKNIFNFTVPCCRAIFQNGHSHPSDYFFSIAQLWMQAINASQSICSFWGQVFGIPYKD